MEIYGKIVAVLPTETGHGKNGTWEKQRYILETHTQYPKKICFDLWGGKIKQYEVHEGDEVIVSYDIESHEWNGNWYTDVKAWKIQPLTK